MTKFLKIALATTAALSAFAATTTVLAGPILPRDIKAQSAQRLPEGVKPRAILPAACVVDPAIQSITLTKSASGKTVTVSYVVVNRGTGAWASGAEQQNASLAVRNGSSGHTYRNIQTLTGHAAAGANMLRFSTPAIQNAFDTFEFSGSVDLSIGYDPDIAIDGNRCNDDANMANNRKSLGYREISEFLGSPSLSRTFT